MLELPPLSLYVHVPWCIKKCPYCDFNSHEQSGELPEADYISALCSDLDSELDQVQGRQISSIFIGGGTPSLFGRRILCHVAEHIDQRIGIADGAEITLEANPGTVEALRFRDYRLAGINRLSLGIQSFSADSLKRLGRIHDDEQARQAVAIARRAGFDHLNLDLMHGSGTEHRTGAVRSGNRAGFEPEHLSWYQLTIEPNTVFYRYTPALPDDEQIDGIQEQGKALLEQRGYRQYEVSAYARGGRESTHNLNYWQFGDYLGIGAGAHGKITNLVQGSIYRSRKKKQPAHYLQSDAARLAERSASAAMNCRWNTCLTACACAPAFRLRSLKRVPGLLLALSENA